jgi:predicted permease
MSHWLADCRYAFRSLRKSPLFTGVAVLSIALGLGANTAIFTLLDQVLLRKLPIDRPDDLVRVRTRGYYVGGTWGSGRELSHPMYLDYRDHNAVFSGIFGLFPFNASVNAGKGSEIAPAELVTGTYFPTLRVGAIRGRLLGPDDDRVPGGHSVVAISYTYWQNHFAADPQIIGRKITINSLPMTIIGVVEPGYDGMDMVNAAKLFVPMMMKAQMTPTWDRLNDRTGRWLNVFARLKPGVRAEQAKASLEPFHQSLLQSEVNDERFTRAPATTKQRFLKENHIDVEPSPFGNGYARGAWQHALWVLMAIVGGVLLIACANVANLLLARGAARQRELAIRLSLGATRARIVQQLLVESLVLSVAGGLAGLLLATLGASVLIGIFTDPESATMLSATPDLRILGFTFAVALITGLLFGAAPALQATKPALAPTLKDQAGSVVGGGHVRLRKALVVSQVMLSLLLLIGAGLFIRSLGTLMTTDLGFTSERLVSFEVDPTANGYKNARVKQFMSDLQTKVRATPGITSAGFASVALLHGGQWSSSFAVEGYRAKENERIVPRCNAVSPGYFEAMGIPLLMGRDFGDGDFRAVVEGDRRADPGYRVAIASESFVKKYIDGNSIGRHIGFGGDPGTPMPIQIVGVVKDSIYTGPGEEREPQMYFPFLESRDPGSATFYARTAQAPEPMLQTMRQLVQQMDANVPPTGLRTVEAQLQRSLVNQRLVAGLSTVFSLLATLLAVVGLYGVMAYSVTRRTREIGVRMALGAIASRVAWLVMREALTLIALGVATALPLAWWLSRYIQSELHGVTPTDPLTIVAAVLTLAIVASAAGLIPAMRAARINPIRALRHE